MNHAMNTPKIFISYAHSDVAWARQFALALKADDVDVWIDTEQIAPGERIQAKLERALKECDVLVSIITPESAKSPNLFFELGVAVAGGKVVIPVVAKGMNFAYVPPPLRQRQALTRGTPKETARNLVEQLELHAPAA